MAKKRDMPLVPRSPAWAKKKESGPSGKGDTDMQGEAFEHAREQARHEKFEVVTHRTDGRIRNGELYDNVPIPPRDKMH